MISERIFGKAEEGIDIHRTMGSNPHANFEQSRPAVNKEEPVAFANPVDAGAKMRSEDQCGMAMPRPFDDFQAASDFKCPTDAHVRTGSNPHAAFEQSRPAVNKEEPIAFANPCESGAKKPSEEQFGKRMPEPIRHCQ